MTRISRVLTLAVALGAAPTASSAQLLKFLDPGSFTNAAGGIVAWNNLSVLPDGTTVVPFGGSFGNGVLTGASVVGGRIVTSTPFSIVFDAGGSLIGFGATLSPLGGPVNVTLSFWNGPGGSVSQRFGGPGSFFLGGIVPMGGRIDHVDVIVDAPLRLDDLVVAAPEPSTVLTLASGLLLVFGVGVRRGRRA